MPQPPGPGSFVWFSLICSREGEESTTAAVTLDTVADESRKKMADGVTRSRSQLCSGDGKICYYGDALSTTFLLLCLASYFSNFLLLPGLLFFFVFLRLCSSHLLLSASTYFIVCVLSACVICTLPHLGILFLLLLFV